MNDTLNIAHIEYSIQTKSIDIFTIGCDACPGCEDCCNPEIKDWNLSGLSVEDTLKKVFELNSKFGTLVDRILVVGGDPVDGYLHHPKDMTLLLKELDKLGKPVFLFTRYEIDKVPGVLKTLVEYIKTGAYIPQLRCMDNVQYGIRLATKNQKIWNMGEFNV